MSSNTKTGKKVTITIDNIPDGFLDLVWSAAERPIRGPMLKPADRENIYFDFPEVDDKLTEPFAEMMALACTMAAIIEYQKQNN